MMKTNDDIPGEGNRRRYEAAFGSAVVAAAFTLAVGAALLVRHLRDRPWHPLTSAAAAALDAGRERLREHPDDEQLRADVRKRDARLIGGYVGNHAFMRTGTGLLLAGAAALLIAGHLARSYRRKLPLPATGDRATYDTGLGRWGRLGVAGLAVLVGLGGGMLVWTSEGLSYNAMLPAAVVKGRSWTTNWPRFRGPGGLGLAEYDNVPTDFDGKAGKNIAWKTPLPLPGHSSPVVWNRWVFLTGATKKQRQVYCVDAESGKIVWTHNVSEAPLGTPAPKHVMADTFGTGYAAPTAVADARHVYAMFATGEIVCLDHAGKRVWGRFLGPMETEYGHGSSLALHVVSPVKARVIVQLDQGMEEDGKAKLLALDALTGKTDWSTKRPVGSFWATPIVINTAKETGKAEQIIVCANPFAMGYNPLDGKEIWRADCLEGDGAPSPIFAGGLVFAVNAGSQISAIRPDGKGNVTKTHIEWWYDEDLPDVCTPVSDGQYVYTLDSSGYVTCLLVRPKAKDKKGMVKRVYLKPLDMPFIASPIILGKAESKSRKLLLLNRKGILVVAATGDKYVELGRSKLGEDCAATPAVVDGAMFLRAIKNLYCIRKKK